MTCSTCGAPLISSRTRGLLTCPNGHGRLVPDPDPDRKTKSQSQMVREQAADWKRSLPIAERRGTCQCDGMRIAVWRIDGHPGPFACWHFGESVDIDSVSYPNQVFACVRSGEILLARRFEPVKLNDHQMKRFGFGKPIEEST